MYPDPRSEKCREIDVLANDPDFYGIVNISAVVECKASSSPWVVLTSNDTLLGYNRLHAMCVSSDAGKEAVFGQVARLGGKQKPAALEMPDRCGYGLRQAFAKDHDPAYAACVSLLTASSVVTEDNGSKIAPRLAFAFPVLVVDSPIFECDLQPDGNLSLREVEASTLLFSAYLPSHVASRIHIVRSERLDDVAIDLKTSANDLRLFLAPKEAEVRNGWRKGADA